MRTRSHAGRGVTDWSARLLRLTLWLGLALASGLLGCVSVAEFRKLEYEVNKMKTGGSPGSSARVADLSTDIAALRDEMSRLEGRVEVSEYSARQALEEARSARMDAASSAPSPSPPPGAGPPGGPPGGERPPTAASVELRAYRQAYDSWRADENEACIDRFRDFLQTYPSSDYTDDAAYWMADCYFKQGDYQTAILRFDDVASRYPTSDKASEALYRQGEALLRLGPRYGKAAEKAFERVLNEYPDSPRAAEAQKQLSLLASG